VEEVFRSSGEEANLGIGMEMAFTWRVSYTTNVRYLYTLLPMQAHRIPNEYCIA